MGKKVLVVDDDEGILDALSLILEESGYVVSALASGDQTLNKTEQFKPDLILLDVLMSGSDGRTICKLLKNQKRTKSIPIIMISAHPGAAKGSLECGADDFIAKPFDSDDLLNKVERYIL